MGRAGCVRVRGSGEEPGREETSVQSGHVKFKLRWLLDLLWEILSRHI